MQSTSTGTFWQQATIPDGVYDGIWSAYEVKMTVNGNAVKFNVKSGIRGLNIPVAVTVTDGVAKVRTKNE